MTDKKFGTIILAAGFSSRMGNFKPLLPLGDKSVIERVLEVSKAVGIEEIRVVTGYNRQALAPIIDRAGARETFNPDFEKGMFTSIQAGAAALLSDLDGFFIMPVDCPLVTGEVLTRLMEQFEADKFTVPCYRGKKGHPLLVPALYRKAIIEHDGKNGLKAITDRDPEKMKRIEVDYEGVVMDMDTPEAYGEIKEYLANGCQSENLQRLASGRRFFLIRHGQIRQHQEKIFLGQTDVPLSAEGQKQALDAGRKLANYQLQTDRLYTSDLLRASQTADTVKEQTGLMRLCLEPGLREMNLGPWDGKFISQIKREFPEEYEKRGRNIMTYKMGHGSENFFDLQYRVFRTLVKLLKADDNRDIIIVAHSGVLRAISNNLKGKDISADWKKLANGEMEIVEL
ncbi:histidine phosphatase family protein [Anaerovorax odorimutans]|uniref:Histidine phosphatase family protein n=1 Tax=Anaerovorax odorimutans TaxID=109327 RepID=A0ABT1RNR9_9FIRM|nr:histidine phosphatase family protein [Anaerovorax odorimutans]MCQ4636838.1 histidine phosphatase family protein [Anaerovorax odorimutans]